MLIIRCGIGGKTRTLLSGDRKSNRCKLRQLSDAPVKSSRSAGKSQAARLILRRNRKRHVNTTLVALCLNGHSTRLFTAPPTRHRMTGRAGGVMGARFPVKVEERVRFPSGPIELRAWAETGLPGPATNLALGLTFSRFRSIFDLTLTGNIFAGRLLTGSPFYFAHLHGYSYLALWRGILSIPPRLALAAMPSSRCP